MLRFAKTGLGCVNRSRARFEQRDKSHPKGSGGWIWTVGLEVLGVLMPKVRAGPVTHSCAVSQSPVLMMHNPHYKRADFSSTKPNRRGQKTKTTENKSKKNHLEPDQPSFPPEPYSGQCSWREQGTLCLALDMKHRKSRMSIELC